MTIKTLRVHLAETTDGRFAAVCEDELSFFFVCDSEEECREEVDCAIRAAEKIVNRRSRAVHETPVVRVKTTSIREVSLAFA